MWRDHAHFRDGLSFVDCRLGRVFSPHTKIEVFTITCYEDMKGNAKCRNCGRLGWLGVTQGHRQCRHSIEHVYDFVMDFNGNYGSIFYRCRVIASYLSKVANSNLPHLHLVPPLGQLGCDLVRVWQRFSVSKNYIPCAIVWRCLHDLTFGRFSRTPTCDRRTEKTDIQTDRHTSTVIPVL